MLRLCGTCVLWRCYSTLPLEHAHSHRQYVNRCEQMSMALTDTAALLRKAKVASRILCRNCACQLLWERLSKYGQVNHFTSFMGTSHLTLRFGIQSPSESELLFVIHLSLKGCNRSDHLGLPRSSWEKPSNSCTALLVIAVGKLHTEVSHCVVKSL